MFHFSHAKKKLSTDELKNNLIKILEFFQRDNNKTSNKDTELSTSTEDKEKRMEAVKRKYAFQGTSPTKKRKVIKDQFPGDSIVGKRISLKFKSIGSKRHHFYKGVVVRKSTNADLEEYMEDDDTQYVDKFDFYTVNFDPPHESDFYCYPLEKEWEDDCLNLI